LRCVERPGKGLRQAFASSSGLTLVEVAAIVGHADASVTAKVYSHLFESEDVHKRVREAQASLSGGESS